MKSAPTNLSKYAISSKNGNAQIWDQKCLIWVFFDWTLKRILSYLKSAHSDLYNWKLSRKKKMPKFWSKNALFWGTILKKYCHILNQHPRFWPTAKFGDKKKKMTKVGTKSTLFGYFEAGILKKLLSYLKSTPSNLPNSKNFGKKQKCLN